MCFDELSGFVDLQNRIQKMKLQNHFAINLKQKNQDIVLNQVFFKKDLSIHFIIDRHFKD